MDSGPIGDSESKLNRRLRDRAIMRLALPALGALAAEPVYVLVDTAIVGHLGTTQLAGVALAGTILASAFWLFNFLAYGTTARVARLFGAGEGDEAAALAMQAFWLALVIGVLLVGVGLLVTGPAIALMGGTGAVATKAETYFRISMVGAPFVLIVLAGEGYLRGVQDMISPLRILVFTNIVNVVLEVIFVFGLDWDVAGSAWGTVIAQAIAAAMFTAKLVQVSTTSRNPHWQTMRSLVKVGGDLFIRTAALLIAFNSVVAILARHGETGIAANQIILQIFLFIALALDAIAIAAQSLIGRLLGAGDIQEAHALAHRLTVWGIAGGTAVMTALVAGHALIPQAFTSDGAVLHQISRAWWIVALMQVPFAVTFVYDGVLMGAGDTRFLMTWALVGAILVCVPLALITIPSGMGIVGAWLAIGGMFVVRFSSAALRVAGGRWAVAGKALPKKLA